jgi:hypothetical protein
VYCQKFFKAFAGMAIIGFVSIPLLVTAESIDEQKEMLEDDGVYELTEEAIQSRGILIADINKEFVNTLKPIFEQKCFDCHDSKRTAPWYASVPIAKQLIEGHKKDAVKDFDMSNDFPFKIKGDIAVVKGIEELADVVKEAEMPPWSYVMVHWGHRLSSEEKKMVLDWTGASLKQLTATQE